MSQLLSLSHNDKAIVREIDRHTTGTATYGPDRNGSTGGVMYSNVYSALTPPPPYSGGKSLS